MSSQQPEYGVVSNLRGRPQPEVHRLTFERARVDGACPDCGASELAAYSVNSEGGWFDVVKCQHCLASVSRVPGSRLGPITLLSDTLQKA